MGRKFGKLLFVLSLSSCYAHHVYSHYLDYFPAMCSEANDREPLDGHIIRLGFIAPTEFGWSFLFPDKFSTNMLERVTLLNNAGIAGQPPEEDYGDAIRNRTPAGFFVVAHIFVGDQELEPLVTCVTNPIPFRDYRPDYYGPRFAWLDVDSFGGWLGYRKFKRWGWKKWNFHHLRHKFHRHWEHERSKKEWKFKRYRRHWRDAGHFVKRDDRRDFRRTHDTFKRFKQIDEGKRPFQRRHKYFTPLKRSENDSFKKSSFDTFKKFKATQSGWQGRGNWSPKKTAFTDQSRPSNWSKTLKSLVAVDPGLVSPGVVKPSTSFADRSKRWSQLRKAGKTPN